ncbi:type VII toxin-antitoxin system MntA family adenylyltransferase antitoxin [Cohnella silvisoli]|uniref:Nucleotidyltransferase domain-containing protein n=1 Tax=Cohnella silvisoli TaxID=2873699 RepID=A0ABV1KTN9_9BACL|nr:nucleotidyltransferase domain-containing protein [Cohnella silvisoli]MCD9022928.1 nucleotidyltransferase domain-containing protein [Cohnella silvisoli]
MSQLSEEQTQTICNFLSLQLNADTVILFGSAAKEQLRNDSDIDLAFISDITFNAYDIFMAAQHLAGIIHREVDLIDFRQASTVFQAQIVGSGIVILDKKPLMRQYSFMRSFKAYAMLNEERDVIMQSYRVNGGVDNDLRYHLEQNGNDPAMHSENP